MSVYIRGMEMPKNCWECHFGHGETGICVVDFKRHGYWNEPQNCPLVPVPPHGDLIDRDALEKDISESVVFSGRDNTEIYGANKIINRLHRAPTIIEAEDSKLSAAIKCGGAVTCAVAYSEEVYNKYVDTAGNLRWTGTRSGEHIIEAEEGKT